MQRLPISYCGTVIGGLGSSVMGPELTAHSWPDEKVHHGGDSAGDTTHRQQVWVFSRAAQLLAACNRALRIHIGLRRGGCALAMY